MDIETSGVDRVLHLVLFLAGAGAAGLMALALAERAGDGASAGVRLRWVVASGAVFAVLLATERLWHTL